MPKQVDHRERREQIADAVCRLVARQGLEAVSLRHVAAEAGVSMGQVQHYFATKDEMVRFAFQTYGERAQRRLAEGITAAAGPDPSPREMLRALLIQMLSLDAESRAEAPLWTAFLARALIDSRFAETLREGAHGMLGFLAGLIRAVQAAGDAPAGLDPDREAVALLALTDGLMLAALLGHIDGDTAVSTIDSQLARVFG